MTEKRDALELPTGLVIDTLIDVGVAEGTLWLYEQFPAAGLVLIDPMRPAASLMSQLSSREVAVHTCAVGAQQGSALINIELERVGRSSLYQRTALTRAPTPVLQREVTVETLDSLASDPALGRIGLKIDTEGHELEVLKGATKILNRCAFILCEVSIAERFENSYTFSELISWLLEHGFAVADIMRVVRLPSGTPLFADVLFTPMG